MAKRNRFTGRTPVPVSLLKRYPNWVLALDEEGVEGQDESTIRPAEIQKKIDCENGCCLTAADVTFADGTKAVALVGGDWSWDGSVNMIDAIELLEPKKLLRLCSHSFGVFRKSYNKEFYDRYGAKLPMTVESRLSRAHDGQRIRFRMSKLGDLTELPAGTKKTRASR